MLYSWRINFSDCELILVIMIHIEKNVLPALYDELNKEPNHFSWITLDRVALQHNASMYRTVLGADATIVFVIKGNAYGHGQKEIVSLVESISDINWLATFSLGEAIAVREMGSSKPILVLGHIEESALSKLTDPTIHCMVDSLQQIHMLNMVGNARGISIPIHIKIDTGLSRFGIDPQELPNFLQAIQQYSGVRVAGVCTHFSEKGKIDSQFTIEQKNRFDMAIQSVDYSFSFIHSATTIDSLLLPKEQCNLFRIGLGLYGYLPSSDAEEAVRFVYPNFFLKPVLRWYTKIIKTKEIQTGTSVGYDRLFIAPKKMKIGIIPVGYFDGVSRLSVEHGYAYHNDIPLAILGPVAMNVTMIDLTNVPELTKGSVITVCDEHIGRFILETYAESKRNIRTFLTDLHGSIPRIPL